MINRLKQFFLSIFSKFTKEDDIYIRSKFNKETLDLFLKLSVYEKKHSILVSKAIERELKKDNIIDEEIVISGLLHDIGKTKYKVNILTKSLIVVIDYITKGWIKRFKRSEAIDIFYNHGTIGYDILEDIGYSERVILNVLNHHNKSINNEDLALIRKYDDMY